ncbi:hypothetical protein HBI71_216040 [Parastagonospora nodorum]|nr:hypothetical protein HBI71_216040 [Parastagonospora nodorum]KAH5396509.1 hypothetical protein HBI47_223380 [Parastagonospora nodorum]
MEPSVVSQPILSSDLNSKDTTDNKPMDNGGDDTSAVVGTSSSALDVAADDPALESNAPDSNVPLASKEIVERMANVETKLERFANLLDPESMGEPLEVEPELDSIQKGYNQTFDRHTTTARRYITTFMWFLGQARKESERATAARRKREVRRREATTSGTTFDNQNLKSLEDLSLAAYLRNDPAEVRWLDWTQFIASRGSYEKSVMCPIMAVIGEPEPQIVLHLKDITGTSEASSEAFMGVAKSERFEMRTDGQVQNVLPERIKLHSGPLYQILKETMQTRDIWVMRPEDGSIVFLRPFKELIYYETQLKDYLELLEKSSDKLTQADDKLKDPDEAAQAATYSGDMSNDTENAKDSVPLGKTVAQNEYATQIGPVKERKALANPVTSLLHLRCLVNFMDDEIKPTLEYVGSDKCEKILFHDLWHLFKPGHFVIDQKEKQAYRVVRVDYPQHKAIDPWLRFSHRRLGQQEDSDDEADEKDTPVKVHCAYIDFDGKQFGPISRTFIIQPYGSLKDTKSLPVYPLRFAKDAAIRTKLVDRGKMLLDVAKFRPMYYNGVTLDKRDEIDSQVVVDFSEALANEERREWTPKIDGLRTASDSNNTETCSAACCLGQAVYKDDYIDSRLTEDFVKSLIPDRALRAPSLLLSPRTLEDIQAGSEDQPTDDEFLVMTYRVFAFVLRSRKWVQLDLTFLRYQNMDDRDFTLSAFDRLALPDGHRDMVESLVTQHFRDRQSSSNEQTDLVKGKGKGLILLLHGAPGVGKTTTAEGVAEKFQKPLFQITCGDLGNTARDVEGELEKNFSLASRWGCILLLDEADVFLSARERKDFERNGLVAGKCLEVYAPYQYADVT